MRTFDQYPRESGKAFAAFCLYRDLGPANRSIARAARKHCAESSPSIPRSIAASERLFKRWSAAHFWQARVADYDRFQEEERRALEVDALKAELAQWHVIREREIFEQKQAQLALSQKLMARAAEMLDAPLYVEHQDDEGKTHQERNGWTFADAAKIGKIALEIGSFALDVPSRITSTTSTTSSTTTINFQAPPPPDFGELADILQTLILSGAMPGREQYKEIEGGRDEHSI